jgi:hypothetical protein
MVEMAGRHLAAASQLLNVSKFWVSCEETRRSSVGEASFQRHPVLSWRALAVGRALAAEWAKNARAHAGVVVRPIQAHCNSQAAQTLG